MRAHFVCEFGSDLCGSSQAVLRILLMSLVKNAFLAVQMRELSGCVATARNSLGGHRIGKRSELAGRRTEVVVSQAPI